MVPRSFCARRFCRQRDRFRLGARPWPPSAVPRPPTRRVPQPSVASRHPARRAPPPSAGPRPATRPPGVGAEARPPNRRARACRSWGASCRHAGHALEGTPLCGCRSRRAKGVRQRLLHALRPIIFTAESYRQRFAVGRASNADCGAWMVALSWRWAQFLLSSTDRMPPSAPHALQKALDIPKGMNQRYFARLVRRTSLKVIGS